MAICCVSGTQFSTLLYPKMTAIEQSMRLMAQKICGIDARKLDILNAEKQEIFLKAKITTR